VPKKPVPFTGGHIATGASNGHRVVNYSSWKSGAGIPSDAFPCFQEGRRDHCDSFVESKDYEVSEDTWAGSVGQWMSA